MSQEIVITDRDGVREIAIDRPDTRNGLTPGVIETMLEAIAAAGADQAIRVLVVTGRQGSFSSGLDLKDAMRSGPLTPEVARERLRTHFHALIRALRDMDKPTIAAVDGAAVGFGCDLALACDLRLLSERARFGEIFVRRGLMPDGGGTYHLPRLVGICRALEIMYTGDIVGADEAVRMGLANHVYATGEFVEKVWAMATRLAKGPPRVYRLIKQSVYASLDGDLDQALEREAEGQIECLQSRDFAEGVSAFFAKREPQFTGK